MEINNEILTNVLNFIDEKDMERTPQMSSYYEGILDALNQIISTNFPELFSVNASLKIVPAGDFLTETASQNCMIEFYVVYQIEKKYINFSVTHQKEKRKKKRLSVYQSIVNSASETGGLQAEDVTTRIANYLRGFILPSQKIFAKRNQIMLKLDDTYTAKITVCYQFENDNLLTVRRVNTWYKFNYANYVVNIRRKDLRTDGAFTRMVRLFKALELEVVLSNKSTLILANNKMAENLLYNVPDEIFKQDENNDLKVFLKVINYLYFKNIKDFKLADETNDMFGSNSAYKTDHAKQLINKILFAYENFGEIIEITSATQNLNNSGVERGSVTGSGLGAKK